jgi:hypothetical protein
MTRGFTSNTINEFAFRLCSFHIKMIKENQREFSAVDNMVIKPSVKLIQSNIKLFK